MLQKKILYFINAYNHPDALSTISHFKWVSLQKKKEYNITITEYIYNKYIKGTVLFCSIKKKIVNKIIEN